MTNSLLEISDLAIGYKVPICDRINATVSKGELIGLIGKNGAGKSTLIKTLLGIHKPIHGNILLEGQSIFTMSDQERATKMSVVFSKLDQVPAISVQDLVYLGRLPYHLWFSKMSKSEEVMVDQALDLIGISALKHKKANQLSDGQLQMVMIARAIAQETDLILMDEPTAHLDLENQFRIFEIIEKIAQQTHKSFIISTHHVELIMQKASQIWWMENQQLFAGFPEQIGFEQKIYDKLSQNQIQFNYDLGRFEFQQNSTHFVNFVPDQSALSFWVKSALIRNGFDFSSHVNTQIQIQNQSIFLNQQKINSIKELIQQLNNIK